MENIKKTLSQGKHSLVVKTAARQTLTFDGRGISDLLQLLRSPAHPLDGAEVADKVVGKAAAALMILGGIKAVHADTVSLPALQLLASAAPQTIVSYGDKVEHIANRTQTGWCPMELACKDATTPEECLSRIQAKLQEFAKENQNSQKRAPQLIKREPTK